MNERLKDLMLEAEYAAPEIAKRAHKLAELIVLDCAKLIENRDPRAEPAPHIYLLKTYGIKQ
jgi:hypothetical protein